MKFYEYKYNGVNYEFRMSNKAKVRIEEEQQKDLTEMSTSEELQNAMSVIQELEKQKKDAKKKGETLNEAEKLVKVASVNALLKQMEEIVSPIEFGYILLHSRIAHKNLTKETYEEIIEDMEDKLGFEETQNIFKEIHDKVFSLIDTMTAKKQSEN